MRILFFLATMLLGQFALATDGNPYAVVGQIRAPDGDWDHASFDADARRLYVARAHGVLAVDVESGKITPTFVSGEKVHVVQVLPGGDLLITSGGSNSAILADGRDGRVKATIPTGKALDIAVRDPTSGEILVVDSGSSGVTIIDANAHSVVGQVHIGGLLDGATVDGVGKMYVVVRDAAQIAVVDIRARKVLGRFDLQGCEQPTGIAYAGTHRLLLVACSNKKAKAINVDDGRSLAELPIAAGADDVLFDGARGLGFIASGGDNGSLAIVRVNGERDIAIVQTLATADGARTLALDTKTGRLYLPTAKLVLPKRGDKPPEPAPGSFGILVIGLPERN